MGTLILLCSEKMATMSRGAFKIAFSGSVKGIPARALSTTATCNGGGPPIEDLPFPQRIRKLLGGVVDESRYNYNYWSQGGTVGREHQQAILGNEDMWLIAPQHLNKVGNSKENPNIVPSFEEYRIMGCKCSDDESSVKWMWIHEGEPRRCFCGYWFQLENQNNFPEIAYPGSHEFFSTQTQEILKLTEQDFELMDDESEKKFRKLKADLQVGVKMIEDPDKLYEDTLKELGLDKKKKLSDAELKAVYAKMMPGAPDVKLESLVAEANEEQAQLPGK